MSIKWRGKISNVRYQRMLPKAKHMEMENSEKYQRESLNPL